MEAAEAGSDAPVVEVPEQEPVAEAVPEPRPETAPTPTPKMVLVAKGDDKIPVQVKDEAHWQELISLHGLSGLIIHEAGEAVAEVKKLAGEVVEKVEGAL